MILNHSDIVRRKAKPAASEVSKSNVAKTTGGIGGVGDTLIYDMVKPTGLPLEHVGAIAQWSIPECKGELIQKGVWFKSNAAGK